jgi:hypothetical protein
MLSVECFPPRPAILHPQPSILQPSILQLVSGRVPAKFDRREAEQHMNHGSQRRNSLGRGLLAFSLCVNLALILAAAVVFRSNRPLTADDPAPAPSLPVESIQPISIPDANPERRIVYVTNRFEWRYLESTNCAEYASNLRAVGCPEDTVRDILGPELEQEYEARSRALEAATPYWTGGRARLAADRRRDAAQADLTREYESIFRTLLNLEWCPGVEGPFGEGGLAGQAIVRFVFGPMPDERLRRVAVTMERMNRVESALRTRFGGIMAEEDERELRSLGLRLSQELERSLTPLEWEELRARMGAVEIFDDLAFHSMGLDPVEFRRLCLTWWDTRGHFDEIGRFDDWRTDEERQAGEIQFTNRVAELLGPDRFPDFVRARDPEFRRLFEFAADRNVPTRAAIGVFDLRQFAEGEAKRLRSDEQLSDEARRQELVEIRVGVRTAVEEMLGPKAYAEYLTNGGEWVTNMTGL